MTKRYHTRSCVCTQEIHKIHTLRRATVHSNSYPPLADSNNCQSWRPIPWINLRGHWLEKAGFGIGVGYTVEVGDGVLVFRVADAVVS